MDNLSAELEKSAVQLAERRKLGDLLDAPRKIEQFASFSGKRAAARAAAQLVARGYEAETQRRVLRTDLVARKITTIEPQAVEVFVREVHGIVSAEGGRYDGWGGPTRSSY